MSAPISALISPATCSGKGEIEDRSAAPANRVKDKHNPDRARKASCSRGQPAQTGVSRLSTRALLDPGRSRNGDQQAAAAFGTG